MASLRPGFVLGSPEEFRPVPLPSKRLRYPQGVEAMRIVDPRTAIPIHYNDYVAFTSPLEDFKRAVSEAGLEVRVHYLSHGDTYEFEVPTASGGV